MKITPFRPWYAAGRPTRAHTPYLSLARLHEEMNRLFDESFGPLAQLSEETGEFSPSVDIDQDEERYTVTLELPGVKREDVSVQTHDDRLVISGTKNRETKSEKNERVQASRQYGRFSQTLSLPEDADREGIAAEFADGVLSVSIPRDKERVQERSRQIEVRQGKASGGDEADAAQLEQQCPENAQGQDAAEEERRESAPA